MPTRSKSRSRSPAAKTKSPPGILAKVKGIVTPANVVKANAAFLGMFSLQFIFVPQFLMDTNFSPSPKLDEFHVFIMRGFGVLALGFNYLTLQVDAKKWLKFFTATNIVFCAALPFYAQVMFPVKLPEHYFAVGGCALLLAAQIYLCLPSGMKFDAPTVFMANAAFLGFFSLQFLFYPEFLMDTNFEKHPKLDKYHLFIMRGFGVLGLFFCGMLLQIDAKKFLPFMSLFMIVFSAVMPFYAQYTLPVKLPDHYLPVGGCAALCLAHIYLYVKSK